MKSSAAYPATVKVIREATPQALHHFTSFDQVNQLVSASEADPALGFMARMMALCSQVEMIYASQQPRQPQRVQARQRPLHALHDGWWRLYKLPFGNFPRLI